jgi:NAD(P)-dependent dehydrogenase (short-subunit alcohol dehydrogenase family)
VRAANTHRVGQAFHVWLITQSRVLERLFEQGPTYTSGPTVRQANVRCGIHKPSTTRRGAPEAPGFWGSVRPASVGNRAPPHRAPLSWTSERADTLSSASERGRQRLITARVSERREQYNTERDEAFFPLRGTTTADSKRDARGRDQKDIPMIHPMTDNSDRTALVTGASSGIGEATALQLAELGFTVYAGARRVDRMSELADRGIRTRPVDVTDDPSMVALVETIIAETGRIDVLVNNAGYGMYGALEDVPIDEARRQFEVNVFGMARLIQLVLPQMRDQGDGYIVNISSMGGKIWEPLGSWYHASKFAVEGLSDSLRVEVAEFGIKVVIIEPGTIRSEWSAIAADKLEAASARTPYARQAKLVGAGLRSVERLPIAGGPEVVAEVIAKAVQSPRPRTRYPAGGGARAILLAERILPDRGFDRFIQLGYRFASR